MDFVLRKLCVSMVLSKKFQNTLIKKLCLYLQLMGVPAQKILGGNEVLPKS